MQKVTHIKNTPLKGAIENAKKEFEKKGYTVQITRIEKCYLSGYGDTETPVTELALVTCLDNASRTYRVYNSLIKRAVKQLDLQQPVWVVIVRLSIGLEMVAEIIEHTDQLELLYQQMKCNLGK